MTKGLSRNARYWLVVAGLLNLAGVGIGAYGWHALDEQPDYLRDAFNIGVQYHMWHALALIGVAWLVERGGGMIANLSGAAFIVGIVLFSGSLYYYGFMADLLMSGLAPLGGWSMMIGWILLALAAWRSR